eukprot:486834_1
MAADFIISMLKDKFNESIDHLPIYSSVQYFDREFALKNSKPSPLKSTKEKRVITQMKEQKQKEIKKKIKSSKPKHDKEYIVFLRFNRLLEGAQQKKENILLEELHKLTNSSTNFFAYIFFGTPGIICIRSTSKVIKKFTKKCTDIGKKAIISYFMDKYIIKRYISNTIQTSKNMNNYNRPLIDFLDHFKFDNKLKTLDVILSGNENKKNHKHKKKQTHSKDMYITDSKYEFNIEIGITHRWDQMAPNKGSLHITIFGESDSKLINKYKFSFKKWRNAVLKFEFSSIDFLKKIGNLNKFYLENFSKQPWECNWIKINIYQISKKNKNQPILKKEYEAKELKAWIRSNSSLFVNLSSKN